MKELGLIERARVDRMLAVCADDPSEYETPARCAMIPYGLPAAYGLRGGVFRLTNEAHRTRREDEKCNETGPRGLATISTEAITLILGLAPRFVPNRTTEAPPDIDSCVAHVPRLPRYGGVDHLADAIPQRLRRTATRRFRELAAWGDTRPESRHCRLRIDSRETLKSGTEELIG